GLVDRHGHRAGCPEREVGECPLVTGPAHDRDPVTDPDPGGDEPLGQGPDLLAELRRADPAPGVPLPPGEQLAPRVPGRPVVGEVRQVPLARRWDQAWDRDLLHGRGASCVGGRPIHCRRPACLPRRGLSGERTPGSRASAGPRAPGWAAGAGVARGWSRRYRFPAMADHTESSVRIAAEPAAVLAVISDFERYPEWAKEV